MILDGREIDGSYVVYAYEDDDLEEVELSFYSAGVPDYIEEHEECIDAALEENKDLMVFPTTLDSVVDLLDGEVFFDGV